MEAGNTIDNVTFGFSSEGIRQNYSKKDDFVDDIYKAYPDVNKTRLKKVLDRVWDEAFAQKDLGNQGAE